MGTRWLPSLQKKKIDSNKPKNNNCDTNISMILNIRETCDIYITGAIIRNFSFSKIIYETAQSILRPNFRRVIGNKVYFPRFEFNRC
jgi:hypothetical protein